MESSGQGWTHETGLIELRPILLQIARKHAGNHADADDLVQDAVLRALERPPLYTPDSNLLAWFRTVIRNLAIDGARRSERKAARGIDPDLIPAPLPEPAPTWIDYSTAQVEAALRLCGAALRETFRMHYFQGRSLAQIAQHLDLPLGTVCTRLFRARARLQRLMRAAARNDESGRPAGNATVASGPRMLVPRGSRTKTDVLTSLARV